MILRDLIVRTGMRASHSMDRFRLKRSSARQLQLVSMEDRLLFSAAPGPLLVAPSPDAQIEMVVAASLDAAVEVISSDQPASQQSAGQVSVLEQSQAEGILTATTRELVFIDTGAENYQMLLEDLWGHQDPARHIDVVLLSTNEDGLAQITETLAQYTTEKLDAVHLVTHGADRAIKLGNTWLDAASLDQNRDQIATWGEALQPGADLLVYGCDLAGNDLGRALLNNLVDLTGADIAASIDDTGSSLLGGDWDLEHELGDVETNVAFSALTLDEYNGLLNAFSVTSAADSGVGSLRQAILDANALGGADTIQFNILGDMVHTITVASELPQIMEQVTIDATTETDFAGTPRVVLSGSGLHANGFRIYGGTGSSIRGLVIQNFTGNGIDIANSNNNVIVGNYIGTSSTGNVAAGNNDGINIFQSSGNMIGGLISLDRNVISGNANNGVNISGTGASNNTVRGNYIGVGADGTTDVGNRWLGMYVNSSGNTIGGTVAGAGNVISGTGTSGTGSYGIYLQTSATGTTIQGNIIGLNAAGAGVVTNFGAGLVVASSGNQIGGTSASARNVISGNTANGILITGSSATGNTVEGNYIGTSSTGLVDLGNAEDGIQLEFGASNNTIGSLSAGGRNIIAGNNNAGISVDGATTSSNTIIGNYVGLGADGSTDLGNTHDGVHLQAATGTLIGGTTSSARNVISGNEINGIGLDSATSTIIQSNYIGTDATGLLDRGNTIDGINFVGLTITTQIGGIGGGNVISGNNAAGIYLDGASVSGTTVQGNLIGTDATGTGSLGNGAAGVDLNNSTHDNLIGGESAGTGNVLAFNAWDGVRVRNNAVGNAILGNSIYSNTETGIDLGTGGVTANDPTVNMDSDSGSNNQQNFPVLTRAVTNQSNRFAVDGSLNSLVNTNFRIEIFSSPTGDVPNGEGRTYLGYVNTRTDSSGDSEWGALFNVNVASGSIISATATRLTSAFAPVETSEFAANVTVSTTIRTVINTNDSGPGSLRQAIIDANATTGMDIIQFSISGGGPHTITLSSELPTMIDTVVIDGSTEPDYASTPVIELNGNNAGTLRKGLTLGAGSGGSTIRGLTINRFTGSAIEITGSSHHTIQGNWIGLNATGTAASANGINGVYVTNSIGNLIGGTTASERNVISGNSQQGVFFNNADYSTISGNYIGTNASGTSDVSGTSANTLQTGVYLGNGSSNNTIGGTATGAGNVISGNNHFGLEILGTTSQNNQVQGNLIGTTANGLLALGNTNGGISFWGAGAGNTLGGTASGARNIVSGNLSVGVLVESGSTGAVIAGNYIGVATDGTTALGNSGDGVRVEVGSTTTLIGGQAAGAGNVIANNTGNGVNVSSSFDTAIVRNSIHSNTSLGINLGTAGVTANGSGVQNYPVLSSAVTDGTQITITGTLNSAPWTSYRIEFYSNFTSDGQGYGEGQTLIGIADETTDGFGVASISAVLTAAVPAGRVISATASRLDGGDNEVDTSEFSQNVIATAALNADPVITSDGSGNSAVISVAENSTAVTTVTATDSDMPAQSLTYSLSGVDQAWFAIHPTTGVLTFATPPNYETPTDAGGNNVYNVTVQVSDGAGGSDTQDLAVTVTNQAITTVSAAGAATVGVGASYTLNLTSDEDATSWTINWGDGTIQSVAGAPTSVTHTYVAGNSGLTFNILASATDDAGAHFANDLLAPTAFLTGEGLYRFSGPTGSFSQMFSGAELQNPTAVLVGPDGLLYAAGHGTDNIVRYNAATGAYVDTFVAAASGTLNGASGLAFGPDGHLYVSSQLNDKVLKFDGTTGAFLSTFVASASGGLDGPTQLVFRPDGYLYVASYNSDSVLRFNATTGAYVDTFVTTASGSLNGPASLVWGHDGNLYVSSTNSTVKRYNGTTGAFIDNFVTAGSGGLGEAFGLAFGPDGHLYVSSFTTDQIVKYNGTTGALIGDYVASGSGGLDGPTSFTFRPNQQVKVVSHGITVTPTSGLTTTEAGGTATFSIVLTSAPTANVTIQLSSSDTTEGTISGATLVGNTLTFTAANWNTPQVITVTGVNDAADDGNVAFSINTTAAVSTDLNYNDRDVSDVAVTNTNDDVTLTGLQYLDGVGDGSDVPTAILKSTVPTDTSLDNFDFGRDSYPGLFISKGGSGAGESDPTKYQVWLTSATGNQIVNSVVTLDIWTAMKDFNTVEGGSVVAHLVEANTDGSSALSIASATITRGDWDTANTGTWIQDTFNFGMVNHTTAAGKALGIKLLVSGSSSNDMFFAYDATNYASHLSFGTPAGITVSPTTGLTTTEAGGTTSFSVVLNSAPTADVTIQLGSTDTTEGTISGATLVGNTLTFTSANWNTPQIISVTGVNDAITDGDISYSITTLNASSTDLNYNGLNPSDVSVTNTDNDLYSISGTVFEDVDGDGLVSDDGVGLANAIVSLYRDDGDGTLDAGDSIVNSILANASGQYTFGALSNDTYWVVVDSRSFVGTTGLNTGSTIHDQWAEQTYGSIGSVGWDGSAYTFTGTAGAFIGGMRQDRGDNSASLLTGEHITRVALSGISAAGIDYGFSYNVITNTRDGDEVGANNRTIQGSLRQFIQNSNALADTQSSNFEITNPLVGGAHTIDVSGLLPAITDAVNLDASTESDFAGLPIVVLNGATAGLGVDGLEFVSGSAGSTVRGFVIQNFDSTGIWVNSTNNITLAGNFIGTDVTGTVAAENSNGILVEYSSNVTIGGLTPADRNVISGSRTYHGVWLDNTSNNNTVVGNFIGTDLTGELDLGNFGDGVRIDNGSLGNTIGGTTAAARNVISGNQGDGVGIQGVGTTGNVVQGNYIGTDDDGEQDLGNSANGVNVSADGNTIGGSSVGAGNVISGNSLRGVYVTGTGVSATIRSNYVGTDKDGLQALGNSFDGIEVNFGAGDVTIRDNLVAANGQWGINLSGTGTDNKVRDNTVGLNATQAAILGGAGIGVSSDGHTIIDNTIGGSNTYGIYLTGSSDNTIQGNYIGTNSSGTTGLGNSLHGIGIDGAGANDNLIGGTSTGEGNVFANNAQDGVAIASGAGTRNTILGNMFRSNGDLGIDLHDNGVTGNDPDDTDPGSNALQNYPEITSASLSGTDLTLGGSLNTDGPSTQYRIEFYGNPSGTADITNGEGRVYLGSTTVTTNASGDATFSGVTLTGVSLAVGDSVTATATRIESPAQVGVSDLLAYGSTSEFAANLTLTSVAINNAPVLVASSSLNTINEDDFTNPGTLVSQMVDTEATDPDSGALKGIAITSVPTTDGTWEYTLDGTTWISVGTPSITSALLLTADATTAIRFVPNANFNGSTGLLFYKAWDQTTGMAGGTADVTSAGADTAFSAGSNGTSVTVTAINDAPALTPYAPTDNPTEDEAQFVATIATVLSGSISDVDSSPLSGITIFALAGSGGTLEYTIDGGTSWLSLTSVSASSALLLRSTDSMRFTPDTNNGGVITLDYRAWDQTTGTAGSTVDVSTTGGTTAFSSASDQVTVNIASVNDAPTITNGMNISLSLANEDAPSTPYSVSTLLITGGLAYTDVDTSAVQGIAITEVTGGGNWQYSTNGLTWINVTGVFTTNALLLDASTQLRFNPDGLNGSSPKVVFRAWDRTSGTASTNATPFFVDPGIGGSTTAFSTSLANLLLSVTSINDSPTIGGGILSAILEDTTNPAGATVGSLVSGTFFDVDSGASLSGIVITSNNAPVSEGIWQYSSDSGTNWFDVGTVGVNALALEVSTHLRFVPAADFNGTPTSLSFRGLDNSYAGGFTSGASRLTVDTTSPGGTSPISSSLVSIGANVTAVNDAPIRTSGTVANLTVIEDAGLTSLGFGSVAYSSGGGADESGQTLTYSVTAIPSVSLGRVFLADGTTPVTLGAYTLADIQGMQFLPTSNASGSSGFQYNVTDSGGTANGGLNSISQFVLMTVTGVNDSPVVTTTGTTLAYTENDAATPIDAGLTVSDVDNANVTNATVSISTNYVTGQDTLAFTNQLGITGSWDSALGVLTLSGTTTKANYQSALRSVTYVNTSNTPSALLRTVSVVVSDGTLGSTPATRNISVAAINNAPTITANTLSISEGGTVVLSNNEINSTDADNAPAQLTYSATSITGGQFELVAAPGSSITSFTQAQINSGAVQFVHDGGEVAPSYSVTVSDGSMSHGPNAASITFSNVNDAPTISTITNQTINEDAVLGPLAFTIGDNETSAASLMVTATSSYGALIPNGNIVLGGSGANRTVTLTPALNQFGGPIAITLTVSDGTTSTQTTFEVMISAVNDSPTIGTATFSLSENTSNGTAVGIVSASDPDDSDTQTFSIIAGDVTGAFAIDNTGRITVADSVQLDYETTTSWSLTVRVRDTAGASANAIITINLTDVNDNDPVITSHGGVNTVSLSLAENTTAVTTISSMDADAGTIVTYSIIGNDAGLFQIDTNTGVLSFQLSTDYETPLDADGNNVYEVSVSATDGVRTDSQSLLITVTDASESAVTAILDSNIAMETVAENATTGTPIGITAFADDADGTDTVSYSLLNSAGGRFVIDGVTGVVTLASGLDYETATSHTIRVQALSSDGTTSEQDFVLTVTDVNETGISLLSDSNVANDQVTENSIAGTVVGVTAFADDLDGDDTISYSLINDAGGRFAINGVTGVVTVAAGIDYETAMAHSIRVQALSTDGSTSFRDITINIIDLNEYATTPISDSNAAIDQVVENANTGTVVGITAFADDLDGTDSVSYSLTSNAGGRLTIDSTTGIVTVAGAIDFEATSSLNLTVQALSTDGSLTSRDFVVAVLDANDNAPLVPPGQSFTLAENSSNGTTVGTVLAADVDTVGSLQNWTITGGTGVGALAINAATGEISVNNGALLDFESAPSLTLFVSVSDGIQTSSVQSVTINLSNVNEAPQITGPANTTVGEDGMTATLPITVSDIDTATATLVVTATSSDQALIPNGSIVIAGSGASRTVTITPRAEMSGGPVTITLTVSDGLLSTQTTFLVTVAANNDAPTISVVPDQFLSEDTTTAPLAITLGDIDTSVNALTVSASSSNQGLIPNGNLVVSGTGANRTVTITPSANMNGGPVTITLIVSDGTLTSQQTFTVNVAAVNDLPIVAPQGFTVSENSSIGTVVGTVIAADIDTGDALSYAISAGNTNAAFAIDSTTGLITVANSAALDFEATPQYLLTVSVTDRSGTPQTTTITIRLLDRNEVPTSLSLSSASVNENSSVGTLIGQLSSSDVDAGDGATYSLLNDAGGLFTVDTNTGAVTVNGGLDFEASSNHTIVARITDNSGLILDRSFVISLVDLNEAPVLVGGSFGLAENSAGGTLVGTLIASDVDAGDSLTFSLVAGNTNGAFSIHANTGAITVANSAAMDFESNGTFTLTARVTDRAGLSQQQLITVTLSNVNESPTVLASTFHIQEWSAVGSFVGVVTASDIDAGDQLTYSFVAGNTGGRFAIDPSTGLITVANSVNFSYESRYSYTVTVQVQDAAGLTQSAAVTLVVDNVNQPPLTVGDQYLLDQFTSLTTSTINSVLSNDSDPDSVGMTAILVSGPQHGTLTLNADGTLTYSPDDDFSGVDTFTYQATDGLEFSSPTTVTFDVSLVAGGGSGFGGDSLDSGDDGDDDTDSENESNDLIDTDNSGDGEGDATSSTTNGLTSGDAGNTGLRPNGSSNTETDIPFVQTTGSDPLAQVLDGIQQSLLQELNGHRTKRTGHAQRGRSGAWGTLAPVVRHFLPDPVQNMTVSFLGNQTMWNELNSIRNELRDQRQSSAIMEKIVVGTTTAVTGGLTVGYVIWLIRGGSLLATMVSVVPTWVTFDPLPVMDRFEEEMPREDHESLASIVSGSAGR